MFKKISAVLALGVAGSLSQGAGFQLYSEGSAESLGMGGAMSARRDMLSNVWFNPASVSDFKESQLMLGGGIVKLSADFSSESASDTESLEDAVHFIPHFYWLRPVSEKLTAAVSFTVPYGLGTDWDEDWTGLLDIDKVLLRTHYLTPTLTYKVSDKLSLAAGVSAVYSDLIYRANLRLTGLGVANHEADAFGSGWLLAANYKPTDDWSFGVKYQSRVKLTMKGEVHYSSGMATPTSDVDGVIVLPPSLTLGVANTSIDKWTFGFDVVWTGWNEYDHLGINYDIHPSGGPNFSTISQKRWDNVLSYRLGAEYQLNEKWRLRSGFIYDESPINDRYRGAELPGNTRHIFSLGCSYDEATWGVDAAAGYMLFRDSRIGTLVGGNPGSAYPADGKFEDVSGYMFTVSYRVKF